MSRITEAYRKSGVLPFAGAADLSFDRTSAAAWADHKVPWDLGDAPYVGHPPTGRETRSAAATPAHGAEGGRNPYARAIAPPPPDELLPLVHRLVQERSDGRLRSLLFTALDADQGPEICAGTAQTLAARGNGSVCLVDADLRCPSLHAVFGARNTTGLSDLLRDGGDVHDHVTEIAPNLSLLAAGSQASHPVPLLGADDARALLDHLRRLFDYVFLQAPRSIGGGEAVSLGVVVDGVVLVVAANATRREAAKRAAECLAEANVRVIGAVLTNRTFPIPAVLYRKL